MYDKLTNKRFMAMRFFDDLCQLLAKSQ